MYWYKDFLPQWIVSDKIHEILWIQEILIFSMKIFYYFFHIYQLNRIKFLFLFLKFCKKAFSPTLFDTIRRRTSTNELLICLNSRLLYQRSLISSSLTTGIVWTWGGHDWNDTTFRFLETCRICWISCIWWTSCNCCNRCICSIMLACCIVMIVCVCFLWFFLLVILATCCNFCSWNTGLGLGSLTWKRRKLRGERSTVHDLMRFPRFF